MAGAAHYFVIYYIDCIEMYESKVSIVKIRENCDKENLRHGVFS